MKARLSIVIALISVSALALAACGTAAPAVELPAVEGTSWQLVSYLTAQNETVEPLPGTEITTVLNRGEISGTGSCNRYLGNYTVVGDKVTVKALGTTEMYCSPEELMAQEKVFMSDLNRAASYKLVGKQLQLFDEEGAVLLTYTALEPSALVGTDWGLTSYNNGRGGLNSPVAGTEITALFGADGNVTGSGGCNTYSAAYTVDGIKITMGPVTSTKMACADPKSVMDQETAYLAALQTATRYQIEADELTLWNGENLKAAVFRAR